MPPLNRYFFVFFLMIWGRSLLAIQSFDSLQAEILYNKTRSFFNKAQYDSSAHYAKKASETYALLGDWKKYLFCRNTLGYCRAYSKDLVGAARIFKDNILIGSEKLDGTNSEYIMTYAHLSHPLKKMGLLDSALYYSELAIALAEKNPVMDSTIFARIYLAAANVQSAKFQLDKAMSSVKKGLWIKKNQQDSIDSYTQELHNSLAIVYYYKNNFNRAIIHYRKALQIASELTPDNLSYPAMYLSNIGLCYMIDRNLDSASYLFEKSLQIRIELFGAESLQASRIYENLGFVHKERGAFEKALTYYQKALSVYQDNYQPLHPRIASTLSKMAFVYSESKEYEKAATYLRQAIELNQKIYGIVNRLAANYKDLGSVLIKANRFYEARSELNHALEIIKSQNQIDGIALADTQTKMAELEILMGNYDEANGLLINNLKIYTDKYGPKNFNVADMYIELASLRMRSKKYDEALSLIQKGLCAVVVNFEEDNIHQNPKLEDNILRENTLLKVLKLKAIALHRKYEQEEGHQLLNSGLATSELGISLAEKIRNGFLDEESKLSTLKTSEDLLELGILNTYQLGNSLKDDAYLKQTFLLSEKSKSSVLRQTMLESKARSFANIPDSLLQKENDLRAEISFLDSKLNEEENNDINRSNEEDLRSQRFDLKRQHEQLVERFEQDFPKYFDLKYKNKSASVEQVQSLLAGNQNLIEYYLGDSTMFIWVLNQKGLTVKQIPIQRHKISESVKAFKQSIRLQDQQSYAHQAKQLYDILIQPVRNKLVGQRLIIVADAELWELNFETLLSSAPVSIDYQSFDFLLKEFAISYAYSANLLYSQLSNKPDTDTRQEVLAFSFNNEDQTGDNLTLRTLRSDKLEDLPGSRKEIRMISEFFDGNYFFGHQASEATFKALAEEYFILHLALHGQADSDHPYSSSLNFTTKSDSTEDGRLYGHELYNLSLPAELAVLSACNTGVGKLISGEGLMTLGRAFTYAGCKSLIYTQWEIPDTSAPQLMQGFYKGLEQGKTKDVALQEAKLAFLAQTNPAQASPFFWGGFVLQGVTEPLGQSNSEYTIMLALAAALGLGVLSYRWLIG
ncbi:MAG: CHAT domain-containing tetratricopeptide repeat protein [Reichenbachiella sp.]|uniref:CHAT domain-containing protein n=1 Tax=Reichenbachiella sp. TaxID=2184521 RepID=UPI002966C189|nr:CHAT domain-containing tetratricopeptide repeat protein [Reichenbachiella sp.]MDW3209205.1 CHAT domain-containing tetratricopeptide repeat protein [Reichenbachiella sp.]